MRVRRFLSAPWLSVAVAVAGTACERNSKQSSSGGAGTSAATSASASVSGVATAAAASASNAEAAQQAAEDESIQYELQSQHRHHHRGFAGLVFMAVETLGIAPNQQMVVEKLRKELYAKMRPLREANGALLRLLGDSIAAGTIDKTKVHAAVAKVFVASSAVPGAAVDTLNELHATLRPEQRIAFVDKVDAHWTAWKESNVGDQATEDTKPHGYLAGLAKELGLTSEQVDKVCASFDRKKDSKKPFDASVTDAYLRAFGTAFVADTFDAKEFPTSATDNTRVVVWGAERMARFYEALTPALNADQRMRVAEKLRQRALDSTPKEKS
jgi:Spy/CpxP family protein refolding chaperone